MQTCATVLMIWPQEEMRSGLTMTLSSYSYAIPRVAFALRPHAGTAIYHTEVLSGGPTTLCGIVSVRIYSGPESQLELQYGVRSR